MRKTEKPEKTEIFNDMKMMELTDKLVNEEISLTEYSEILAHWYLEIIPIDKLKEPMLSKIQYVLPEEFL